MKTGVSLSVYQTGPGTPVLFSGAARENLSRIKEYGYDGVDLFIRDPRGEETKEALRSLEKSGLGIGVIMPAALAGQGLFLGDRSEIIRKEAVRQIQEFIRLAHEAQAMVSLGLVRGNRVKGESMDEFELRFTESCKRLLETAEPLGVDLVLEPINRYEINTINSVRQGMDYIKRVRLPLYLMADTFHMNIEDVDLEEVVREAVPLIRHVHFVDSNRLAPSMGHMNMEGLYEIFKEEGYQGYLCLEAFPDPDPISCAGYGARFFARMNNKERSGGNGDGQRADRENCKPAPNLNG